MAGLALLDISTRLALALLRILESPAHAAPRRPLRLCLSQTELAHMIGSARENVDRCLKPWEKREIVDIEDGWRIVTDEKSLRLLADREWAPYLEKDGWQGPAPVTQAARQSRLCPERRFMSPSRHA
ncbi:helix-turn-helix domain-containing protein [Jiella avicenniae]|uniref:Helix-turn-helix domain-containing protein n=1 Tax=Jiella avicenniae TaxID=2907202 RepID=A0A9X1T5Z0_9HYPH|nr:helix-turn-helix domain-containing protein [Jiella avicenniae]MCE7029349.1 helix-turn-helix domain-containing protein [Jiella avicenniae]